MQTIFPFKVVESKRFGSKMTSFGGVALILETYRALGLNHVIARKLHLKERGWDENAIMEELIALQVAGGDCMEDVDYLKADDSKILAGYETLPSASTVGRFLHSFDAGINFGMGM